MESRKQWEELFRLTRDKDWRGAIKCINAIIGTEPENPNHYLKKGDICLKAGDGAESLNSYLKAAWYLDRGGFLKKALAVYKMALRFDPDNDDAIRAANRIMMDLESPPQSAGKTEWTEVFVLRETSEESPVISPETGVAEPAAIGQNEETSPLRMKDILEATSYSEEGAQRTGGPGMEFFEEKKAAAPGEPLSVSPGEMGQEPVLYSEKTGRPVTEPETVVPLGFLSYFTTDEIEEVLKQAELKTFSDGETVVQEGDTGDSIYTIKNGSALVVGHFFGKVVQLETLSPGDLFGEIAFLTGRTRTANVTAKGELEVYEINRLLLEELIEKRPEILSELNEIYIKRVRDTVRKVRSL
jgi:tetratricopeptide (TPR) repeat protein